MSIISIFISLCCDFALCISRFLVSFLYLNLWLYDFFVLFFSYYFIIFETPLYVIPGSEINVFVFLLYFNHHSLCIYVTIKCDSYVYSPPINFFLSILLQSYLFLCGGTAGNGNLQSWNIFSNALRNVYCFPRIQLFILRKNGRW